MNHLLVDIARFQSLYPHLAGMAFGLLKSTAIIALAAGTAALLQRRSARARNWVWRCALAGLIVLPIWHFLPAQARPAALAWRAMPTAGSNEILQATQPTGRMGGINPIGDQPAGRERSSAWLLRGAEETVLPLWIGVAFLLAMIHLLRSIAGSTWLRRHSCRDGGDSAEVEVRITRMLDTPVLAGFFHPAIYLPAEAVDWPTEKRRCVLRHEMAHRSRGDVWWQIAGTCACCLWWWNPALWMALGHLKAEAEEAADDMVILEEDAAENYARLLVEIASGPSREIPAGIPMLGRSSLEQRIRQILSQNPLRNTIGAAGAGLLGALSALIILCMSVGLVLGEADLTNGDGEIVHWQAKAANNQLAQGNFQKTGGKLDEWTGSLTAASSPDRGSVRLKTGSIETTLKIQPDWKWLTVIARLRPAPNTTIAKDQEATVSFTPEDGGGKSTGIPTIIREDRRADYTNWTSRIHTMPVAAGTTQLKVQMQVTAGAGELDCSEILVIPSQPGDELDHRLVDQFFKAIEAGDEKTVLAMLKEEPKLVNSRKGRADNGTPLILCAWKELPAMAQILVDHGADLAATDTSSWKSSALAWCGWWGSPKTAEVLLKAGADPNFKSVYGVTPLNAATGGKGSNKASKATPEAFDQTIALFKAAQK